MEVNEIGHDYLSLLTPYFALNIYMVFVVVLKVLVYVCNKYNLVTSQQTEKTNEIVEYISIILFISIIKLISYVPYMEIPINIIMVLVCCVSLHDNCARKKVCLFLQSLFVVQRDNAYVPNILYNLMCRVVRYIDNLNYMLYALATKSIRMQTIFGNSTIIERDNTPSQYTPSTRAREIMDEYELDE